MSRRDKRRERERRKERAERQGSSQQGASQPAASQSQTPAEARRQRAAERAKERRDNRGGGSKKRDFASLLPWILAGGLVIVVLIVVGVLLSGGANAEGGAQVGDHWHASLMINACGESYTPAPSKLVSGMHTHGDGNIHVEPTANDPTGSDANLKRFYESLDGTGFRLEKGLIQGVGAQAVTDPNRSYAPAAERASRAAVRREL